MAAGIFALLDDVALIAKATAGTLDDVAAGALKASAKTTGVVIDDMAVTPQYVSAIPAHRELNIVKLIAWGSIRNKLLIILPAALILSQWAEWSLPILLIFGGAFLAFEGAEKVLAWVGVGHGHDPLEADTVTTSEALHADDPVSVQEKQLISGAVRTDLILSTEIMLIALTNLNVNSFLNRFLSLILIALFMTVLVYGAVALIVRMDDFGLKLSRAKQSWKQKVGGKLVRGMPATLNGITIVGTLAMLWVGGHLLLKSSSDLGFHWLYGQVHHAQEWGTHINGGLGWAVETGLSGLAGLIAGLILAFTFTAIHKLRSAWATKS